MCDQQLIDAARQGNLDKVKELIANRADLNIKENDGSTPLHLAAFHGYLDIVKYLIDDKKADFTAKDNGGSTPLHLAAKRGHIDVVNVLIEKGADVNAVNNDGYTPLHEAAGCGRTKVVEVLLQHNADVKAVGKRGWTPLHEAVWSVHKDAVEVLLQNNAEVNAKDDSGDTPLHLAAQRGHIFAAQRGHIDVVNALIEKGTDVNVVNNDGYTPLHLARIYYHTEEVVEVLTQETLIQIRKTLIQDFNVQKPDYLADAFSTYWDQCRDEVKDKIVKEVGDNGISYLDLLKADKDKMVKYVTNHKIRDTLDNLDYEKEFPIFGSQIKSKFLEGIKRRKLIDGGERVIQCFDFGGSRGLISDESRKIALYLSDADLENLKVAHKNAYKNSQKDTVDVGLNGANENAQKDIVNVNGNNVSADVERRLLDAIQFNKGRGDSENIGPLSKIGTGQSADSDRERSTASSNAKQSIVNSNHIPVQGNIMPILEKGDTKGNNVPPSDSSKNVNTPHSTQGNKLPIITASIGLLLGLSIAYLAEAATLTPAIAAVAVFIAAAIVGALVGYGIGKLCEKVSGQFSDASATGHDPNKIASCL